MRGVAETEEAAWKWQLAVLSVRCMAVTDQDMHENFECKEVRVEDETLVAMSDATKDWKELDAIVHYVLSKDRPLAVLKRVIKMHSIEAMTRFLKYATSYEWSEALNHIAVMAINDTAKWLDSEGVDHEVHCAFVASYANALVHMEQHGSSDARAQVNGRDRLPVLVDLLRASRSNGTYDMHSALLHAVKTFDTPQEAIQVVAMYLEDEHLGRLAARMLRYKDVDAEILPYVYGMSCHRKNLTRTCMLVNKIALPNDDMCTKILEQVLRGIKRPVTRDAESVLRAIQSLTTVSNVGSVCESMGDIMRLWLRAPEIRLDDLLELIKDYMWTQRNYLSDTESAPTEAESD